MNKYLVTGGAGFIGSHITDKLLSEGNFVRVLDNFSSGKKENLESASEYKNFELIKGDIRNYSACLKAAKGIDYVLHQAALRSVPGSMKDPYIYNSVNINGTLNLLRASLKNKIKRFVFASSASVYGETDIFPEKEDSIPQILSPYALSKLTGEYYCRIFSMNYNLPTLSLRYFNVFGPRQNLNDEYSLVIPKFIGLILQNKRPTIYGNGKQSRDFIYIDDVVSANLVSAKNKAVKCGVFNVASGEDYTILDLVKMLNKLMHKNAKPVFYPVRKGDAFKTLGDISKAIKILGYRPKTDFKTGLGLTVDWFKSRV